MTRPVDSAMAGERVEKGVIRNLWAETVVSSKTARADVPLYLTLSGADGKDISLLAEKGIIRRTEVGAIAPGDENKVVAVENNAMAVLDLQRKFPGLRIYEEPIQNLWSQDGPFAWPKGTNRQYCRAVVVNLDLNKPLLAVLKNGQLEFPILEGVRKLSQLHAVNPRLNWSLCLTLHGEIVWSKDIGLMIQHFLSENFAREKRFADSCRSVFGDELYENIDSASVKDLSKLESQEQQHILMAMVPKKIAQLVHQQGWKTTTSYNLRYGNVPHEAPMVTWIIQFNWDERISSRPDAVYRESLQTVFSNPGAIKGGKIQQLGT